MSRAIPDRWLNYKAVGNPVEGTRFVAFKVPLRPNVNKSVKDVENRLDDIILLEKLPNLGFIIDLTNTKRYYDPETFQNRGVQHLKILVPGRVVPPKQLVNRFNDAVSKFLHDNNDNDKLIGVHCTHGVNRSGFFICNYMISQLKINPIDAIKRFSDARGHPIEREVYLNALNCGNAQSEHPSRIDSSSRPMESGSLNSNWRESAKNDVNSRPYNAPPRNDNTKNWRERGGAEPIRRGNGNVTRQINTGTRNIEHQQHDDRGSRRNTQNEQRSFRRSDNERSKARGDARSDKGYEPNRRDERRYNSDRYNAGARSDDRHYDSGAVNRRDDRRFNSDRCDADARSDDIRYDSGVANRRDERGYNTDRYSANARSDDIRYDSGVVNRRDVRGYNTDHYNANARPDDIRYDSGAVNRIDDGGYNSDRYNANAQSGDIRYDSGAFNRIDDGGYNFDRYNANARPDDIRYDSGAVNRIDDGGYNFDRYNATAQSGDIRYDSGTVHRRDDGGFSSDRYNAGAVNRSDDDSRFTSNGRDDLRFYSSAYGLFNSHETQKIPMFAPRPVPLPLPLPLPMPLPLPLPPPMPLPTQANGHSEFTGSRFARSQNFLLDQRNSLPTHNYNQNKSWNKDNNRNIRTEPTAFYSRKPATSRTGSNGSSSLFGRSSNNYFVNS